MNIWVLVTVAAFHNSRSLGFNVVKCCIASVFEAGHLQHDVLASEPDNQLDYLVS
jgi:hypothetical protein